MLLIGAFIIVFSLIFMLFNLSKSDSIIIIWLPFMISGIALIFIGFFFFGEKRRFKR